MAKAACKIIINNGYRALSLSLEQILINLPLGDKLSPETRYELIQMLADIDTSSYSGGAVPGGGLKQIMERLQELGILSDDVWKIYAR